MGNLASLFLCVVTTTTVSSLEYGEDLFPNSNQISRYNLLYQHPYLFSVNFCVVNRASWAEVCGTRYCRQSVVVLNCALVPEFGLVRDIVLDDLQQPCLVCEILLTDCFVYHYHSYKVLHLTPAVFCIKKPSELYDHSLLSMYSVESSLYITLKYHLVEKLYLMYIHL